MRQNPWSAIDPLSRYLHYLLSDWTPSSDPTLFEVIKEVQLNSLADWTDERTRETILIKYFRPMPDLGGRYYKNLWVETLLMLDDILGSGGGSVSRAVASDTRDPRFESQDRQNFIY